jgi:acyl-CoA reductase-like NAD-dependent aldehyde dehydrogenase
VKVEKLNDRVKGLENQKPAPSNPWHRVVEQLTEDEQEDLARAIMALEKSHGTASLETLPPEQRAAWLRAHELYERPSSPVTRLGANARRADSS